MNNKKLDVIFYGPRLTDVFLRIEYRLQRGCYLGVKDMDYIEADVPKGIIPTTSGNLVPMDDYRRILGRN